MTSPTLDININGGSFVIDNIGYEDIQKGFETFKNPADRREVYHYRGKTIHYLRIKQENPETMQNALDTIARDNTKKAIFMGL